MMIDPEERPAREPRRVRWYNPKLEDHEWRAAPGSDEEALDLLDGSPQALASVYREWRDLGAGVVASLIRAGEAALARADEQRRRGLGAGTPAATPAATPSSAAGGGSALGQGAPPPELPPGYRLNGLTDPDVLILRRPDGSVVAVFSDAADPREIERAAREDRGGRSSPS